MYLWWSVCTLCLLACQVRVTVDNSSLCCCLCDIFRALINVLFVDSVVTLTSVTEVYVIERQGGNTNKGNRSEGSQLTGRTGLAADGVVVSRRTETPAIEALTFVLRTVIISCTRSVQPV